MADAGYTQLISYRLACLAFDIGWQFVPLYYVKYEDNRQRDQIKQALRSTKQNIVEGSAERSLSSKLKLYDVAKASCVEALEDFLDILRLEELPRWNRFDPRLQQLHQLENSNPYNSLNPSNPSILKTLRITEGLGGREGLDGLEAITNYQIDLLVRCGYLLDRQIRAVELKHQREGGYRENPIKATLSLS